MFPTVSPGELWELYKTTKELIEKIKDAPEHIEHMKKRLRDLESQLNRLKENFLTPDGKIVPDLKRSARDDLLRILTDLYSDIDGVNKILAEWDNRKGPLGTTLPAFAPKLFFALGKNPERLDNLEKEIAYHRAELNLWLTTTIAEKLSPAPTPPPVKHEKRKPTILFLDKDNIGRSKVAEAYVRLLQDRTWRSTGHRPLHAVHSAGLHVARRSEVVDLIQPMGEIYHTTRLPSLTALAALFDNKFYDGPYKDGLWKEMQVSMARGVPASLFRDYEYILVFSGYMQKNLVELRTKLVERHGKGIAPERKGRVVLLGEYAHVRTEVIPHVERWGDETAYRTAWNSTVGVIKGAVKGWLKAELGWKQPEH
ncbi:hypothetical protein ANO11243_004250 [Dothideomycetidae sp. 11243]|nr:hypothetical protein ANO11243_004250 [fungal sp. No.11243]